MATSSTLAAGSAPRGSTVVLTAAWSDGLVTGATATSNPITVVNAPPTVTALSLEPTPITAADTVSALVAATDPEGDAVTLAYAWTVDGVYAGAAPPAFPP